MNYATVLAWMYINFITGINLESSVVLRVNFPGISPPFSSSCSLCFTALFGIVTSWHCSVPFSPPFFKPRSLSFAIFLATSDPVNSCSPLLSFTFILWKYFIKSMGLSHRKPTKINIALFRLWPPCCATRRHPYHCCAYVPTSNTASHDKHEKINSWFSFAFLYNYGPPLRAAGAPLWCLMRINYLCQWKLWKTLQFWKEIVVLNSQTSFAGWEVLIAPYHEVEIVQSLNICLRVSNIACFRWHLVGAALGENHKR